MKKIIIISSILILFILSAIYFYGTFAVLYTEDFYYRYIIVRKIESDFSLFYINLDREIFKLRKTDQEIKKNELFKKFPELKKALIKAKVL